MTVFPFVSGNRPVKNQGIEIKVDVREPEHAIRE